MHDEAGTIGCHDTVSDPPVRHRMAYMGYEKDRGTVKYRCPARHEGWTCKSESRCNEGRDFGLIVRVDCRVDLRRFPQIPRATKAFEERYKGRTAVERVNGRTKVFWDADDGNLSGSRRFRAYLGVIMVVCVGFETLLAMTGWQRRPGLSDRTLMLRRGQANRHRRGCCTSRFFGCSLMLRALLLTRLPYSPLTRHRNYLVPREPVALSGTG